MKQRTWLSTGTLALLAMATVMAAAQDAAPTQAPKDQEEAAKAPPKFNEITLGYDSHQTNSEISRYARPGEGVGLRELKLFNTGNAWIPYASLTLKGFPRTLNDSYAHGYIALDHGKTVVRGTKSLYRFYASGWLARPVSEDNETDIIVDQQLGKSAGAFVSYKSNERSAAYEGPKDPEHTRTRQWAVGVGGTVAGGNLQASMADRRTFDDMGKAPATLQRRFNAEYSRSFGDMLTLEGSAGYTRIEQAGRAASGVRSFGFGGAFDIGADTGITFRMDRQDIDLNTVLNAYARKRLQTSVRLNHRFPGWNFQFGYKHKETERVRKDQTFVDVPNSNVFDARLSGKIGAADVTLRGSWEDLRATAVMQTLDTRQMLWDDRAMFQAKASLARDAWDAYWIYTYRFQQNKQRGVDLRWNNFVFGGSYAFNPGLSAYAEFASDQFSVQGAGLDGFFPNSRSMTLGLNFAQSEGFSASAGFNFFDSGDVRGSQLTFSARRRLGPDNDIEIVVAPWRRDDKALNLTNYRSTMLSVRYTTKF